MQIGNFVLYDQGQKEGRLITVVGSTASIMTATGPVQWPMSDVKEAPVKVIELSDTVNVEEELTIVQRPTPSHEQQPAIEEDDGDAAGHAADRAEEARVVLTPEEAAKLEPPSEKFITEPLDEPALPPGKSLFDQCEEEAIQLRKDNPNPEVVLKGTPHGDIPVNPETYKELIYGENAPAQPPQTGPPAQPPQIGDRVEGKGGWYVFGDAGWVLEPQPVEELPAQPPQAPPGAIRPGLLDDFGKKPEPEPIPEGVLVDDSSPKPPSVAEQFSNIANGRDGPVPPEEDVTAMVLPKRFGQKWLDEQSTPVLTALLSRPDLTKARLGKIKTELDRRAG